MASGCPLTQRLLLLTLSSLVASVCGLASNVILARALGPSGLGLIAYCLGILGLLDGLANAGLPTTHMRMVARGGDIAEDIGAFGLLSMILTAFAVAVAFSLALFLPGSTILADDGGWVVLGFLALSFVGERLARIFVSTFAGLEQTKGQTVPPLVGALASAAALTLVLFVHSTVIASGALALRGLVSLACAAYLGRGLTLSRPTLSTLQRYVTFAWPLAGATVVGTISLNVGTVIIASTFQSSELALYYTAQRLANVATLAIANLSLVTMPRLSAQFAAEGNAGVEEVFDRLLRSIVAAGMPALALAITVSPSLIDVLFGAAFGGAVLPFQVLALGAGIACFQQPYSDLLIAAGHAERIRTAGALYAFVSIAGSFLLAPTGESWPALGLGAFGAATATAAATGVSMLYQVWSVGHLGFAAALRWWYPAMAAVGVAAATVGLQLSLGPGMAALASSTVCAIAIAGAGAFASGLFRNHSGIRRSIRERLSMLRSI